MTPEFERLLLAVENTSFACGEWSANDSEEEYQDVHDRSEAAAQALRDHVAGLATRLVLDIDAFDEQCGREEYTDTEQAWELLDIIRTALRPYAGMEAPPTTPEASA